MSMSMVFPTHITLKLRIEYSLGFAGSVTAKSVERIKLLI